MTRGHTITIAIGYELKYLTGAPIASTHVYSATLNFGTYRYRSTLRPVQLHTGTGFTRIDTNCCTRIKNLFSSPNAGGVADELITLTLRVLSRYVCYIYWSWLTSASLSVPASPMTPWPFLPSFYYCYWWYRRKSDQRLPTAAVACALFVEVLFGLMLHPDGPASE